MKEQKQMEIQKTDGVFYDVTEHHGMVDKFHIVPHFEHFTSADMYEKAGLKGYAPMTAKEIDTEEQQEALLKDPTYVLEEKFDGTRALLYFLTSDHIKKGNLSREIYLLRQTLLSGSGFSFGKHRIYEFFINNSSTKDRAEFLKQEYGIGGSSSPSFYLDGERGSKNYNASGYEIVYGRDESYKFSWSKVAEQISQMIDEGQYYPQRGYTRCFSRRVSEKTDWYCENTDSLPQLRGINVPSLKDTILDGEMFIPNRPFKDVSSTLNCKWDKAIDRQLELGFIVFHAFDILFYKGIDLRKMQLKRRKVYLDLAVKEANSPYIKNVSTYCCGNLLHKFNVNEPAVECIPLLKERIPNEEEQTRFVLNLLNKWKDVYPELYKAYKGNSPLTPKAYYELIVATGGEGVMLKPLDGKYFHKRGREYQKIKKFLTREVVIMGFTDPTDEYKGKFPTLDKWDYWETSDGDKVDLSEFSPKERKEFESKWYVHKCRPISKFYCKDWVGTIRFGVIITPDEVSKLPKNKKFNIEEMTIEGNKVLVLEVGECSGFDEETREMFSNDPESWVSKVIEIKANEIFKDTGKLRHPRYLRVREDKSALECTYKDHISD